MYGQEFKKAVASGEWDMQLRLFIFIRLFSPALMHAGCDSSVDPQRASNRIEYAIQQM